MQRLYTAAGRCLPEIPWNRYPRPQLAREDWLCLNGSWELLCHGRSGTIRVPFCAESLLSGVEAAPAIGEDFVCRRRFTVPAAWAGRHILLHFGAVMRSAADENTLALLDWICSEQGQELIRRTGYTPIEAKA